MSWSMSKIEVPRSTMPRSRRPSVSLSAVSSPAAGSSMQIRRGDVASAARDPDQGALAVRQLAGLPISEIGRADGLRARTRRPSGLVIRLGLTRSSNRLRALCR